MVLTYDRKIKLINWVAYWEKKKRQVEKKIEYYNKIISRG